MTMVAEQAKDIARTFDVNDIGADFIADPFPTLAALRAHDPLHRNPDGSFFLTRYADVLAVYKHPAMSSDKKLPFKAKFGDTPLYEHHTTSLVFNDPPYHDRVRKLVAAAFTPRGLKALEPLVHDVVDDLVARASAAGTFDLVEDFAIAVPTAVIGEMLGVPKPDRHLLRGWSERILGALDPITPPDVLASGNAAVEEFKAFLRDIIAHRRRHPDEASGGEVLGALMFGETNGPGDGERLTELELLHNCIFILNGGHETTTSLIGHGVHILLNHPDERARLEADPGLIDTAVEEFMRFQSPVQIGNRLAVEDVTIGGRTLPAGTYVHLSIGGANRDPDEFPEPDRVDVARRPNRHLAFAAGRHVCLGNSLARMEARIAIGKLIARIPGLSEVSPPKYFDRARFRGFDRYMVAVR